MKRLLIGFSGKSVSGKTTAAEILKAKYGGRIVSFASILKIEIYQLLSQRNGSILTDFLKYDPTFDLHAYPTAPSGLSRDQAIAWINDNKTTVGNLMQKWGDYRRSTNAAYFIDTLCDYLETRFTASSDNLYVDDVRYRSEALALEELGFELIRIQTSNEARAARGASRDPEHSSETDLDAFWFQHIVFNNLEKHSLEHQLVTKAEEIIG